MNETKRNEIASREINIDRYVRLSHTFLTQRLNFVSQSDRNKMLRLK